MKRNGFTAIEVFAAIAITGVVAMGAAAIFQTMNQTQTKVDRLFWISARKMEFQNVVRSDAGWALILGSNPSMSCFTTPNASCSAFVAPQPLRLPVDGAMLEGANAGLGMTSQGDFCTNFDPMNGNGNCPIGITARWQAICDNVQCRHAQPKITIDFTINDSARGAPQVVNANNRLVVFRDQSMETLFDVCTSMGGVLAGGICTIPSLASACDPSTGSFVLGFDAQGAVICGKPNPGGCAAGDVAYGFAPNGTVLCTSL